MKTLFGTDGIRGKANIYPMTGEVAMALGRAVTSFFQKAKKNQRPMIVIGKDTRLSCYMLEQAFASGVCSQGGRAILTGPLPTPGVAFVTCSMRADAGVMISASHNIFSDNGIKIFDSTGHKLPDHIENELESMILNPQDILPKIDGDLGSTTRLDEVIGRYIVHVKSVFNADYSLENMRLVVDCAHGASYKVAPMVFSELGAEVISIGNAPNGKNINDQCGSLYPKSCADNVVKYRADLGISLDGDADRVTIIDSRGNVIDGDKIIGLCAKFLLDQGELLPGSEVVGTVMSNIGLDHYLRKIGLNFFRTKVGDRYIVEQMKKSKALFGGEPSGHIIFKKYSTTGDGILAALKILEMLKFYGHKIDDLANEVTLFPQVLKNVKVKEKIPFDEVPKIASVLEEVNQEIGNKGRVILRYSGTEDLARVMIEGEDRALIESLCEKMVKVIQTQLGSQE